MTINNVLQNVTYYSLWNRKLQSKTLCIVYSNYLSPAEMLVCQVNDSFVDHCLQ